MTVKNHLLLITTSFPDNQPGSEVAGFFVTDFTESLALYKEITVIIPAHNHRSNKQKGNLTLRRFIIPHLPLSLLTPSKPINWFRILQTLPSGRHAIRQVAGKTRIDHILS